VPNHELGNSRSRIRYSAPLSALVCGDRLSHRLFAVGPWPRRPPGPHTFECNATLRLFLPAHTREPYNFWKTVSAGGLCKQTPGGAGRVRDLSIAPVPYGKDGVWVRYSNAADFEDGRLFDRLFLSVPNHAGDFALCSNSHQKARTLLGVFVFFSCPPCKGLLAGRLQQRTDAVFCVTALGARK